MSLYGALYAGVAGLSAQSNKLGIISDNIANVNTVGYKSAASTFQALVTSSSNVTAYTPGGVLGSSQALVTTQGLLQTTTSATDVAISGQGFLVVNQNADQTGQLLYTRAGSFTQDAQGNFINTAGFFLQAWPLDRNGLLPGEPGNLNTASSANLSSLKTVNVQNLAGTAAATNQVSVGANLKSSQAVLSGASGTAGMDVLDIANSPINGSDIIIPTAVDGIKKGDSLNVSTGANSSGFNYTYGGFTYGRDVTSALSGADGENALNLKPGLVNLNTPILPGANAFVTNAIGSGRINVTVPSTANMRNGDYVNIVGPSVDMDANIKVADMTGTFQIVVDSPTQFHFTAANAHVAVAAGTTDGAGGGAETVTPEPFVTSIGSKVVTVHAPNNGLVNGDVVSFTGIAGPGGLVNGIPIAQLNNVSFVVSAATTDTYQITVSTTNAVAAGGAPTTGTIKEVERPYAGNILDATNPSQPLLGISGIANIDPNALSFTITTSASGTVKFTYTASAPNTSLGEFSTLNNLADAINGTQGLTARVANNRLWVGATDATQAVTFNNTQSTATGGPPSANPVLSGIDWVRELGLAAVGSQANTFSSLQGLSNLVNNSAGLTASLENALASADLKVSVVDPTDTITFKDNVGSQGSLLSQLGLATSQNGGVVALRTAGPTGPAYNAQVATNNMASGAIAPQFSRPVTVYDGLGTAHNLNIAFAKLQNNTWSVEIYAQPASDISSSNATLINGQVATGTIKFNGDGSLQNVSTSLTQSFAVNWTNGSTPSAITINWGTQGLPFGTPGASQIGKTDGLSQFDSGYNVSFVNQNGAPVGQLTAISIDQNGFITASYNNGETQKLYKIPIASFTDANLLQGASGDAYAQSNGSGIVNLKQAGQSGVGSFSPGALESSNVELASQLTDMIVAQRAYQANTKVIQTADNMLQSLDQIIQ